MKANFPLLLVACLGLVVGCEVPSIEVSQSSGSAPAATSSDSDKPEATLFGKEDWYLPDGRVDMSGVEGEPPKTNGTPRPVVAKDPKKGKLTRKRGGAMGTSLQAMPWAENQTIFTITIPSNLATYDALNGKPPQSHKEFMDEFVGKYLKQNVPAFKLPRLEPGDAYLFDPEDQTLKIFRPGDPGAPQVEGVVAYEKTDDEE